jgi:hypothetical protein
VRHVSPFDFGERYTILGMNWRVVRHDDARVMFEVTSPPPPKKRWDFRKAVKKGQYVPIGGYMYLVLGVQPKRITVSKKGLKKPREDSGLAPNQRQG